MEHPRGFKTCRRYNDPGDAHLLTFRCFRRQTFLSKDGSCQWLADAIQKARVDHRFHVWAYVFMPEHVHLLIWPTAEYDIGRILEAIKLPVTRRAVSFVRKNSPNFLRHMRDEQPNGKVAHRFWQRGGGYDQNINEPKVVWATIEYIHANPLRRQLCLRPEDWPWSSAGVDLGLREGPIPVDRQSLPRTIRG